MDLIFWRHAEAEEPTAGMADLVEELTGLGRAAAISLASVRASLRVTQVVNPAVGVHAVMPVDALMR